MKLKMCYDYPLAICWQDAKKKTFQGRTKHTGAKSFLAAPTRYITVF